MSTTVRFEDNSKSAKASIQKQRDIALTLAAINIQGNCIARTPKLTGHLRGSIGYKTRTSEQYGDPNLKDPQPEGHEKIGGSLKEGDAIIGTNVNYAAHVEYGTKYKEAQSFMRTGFDASKGQVDAILKQHLGKGLKIGEK